MVGAFWWPVCWAAGVRLAWGDRREPVDWRPAGVGRPARLGGPASWASRAVVAGPACLAGLESWATRAAGDGPASVLPEVRVA